MVKAVEGLENILLGLLIAASWLAPFVLTVVLIDKVTKKPQPRQPIQAAQTSAAPPSNSLQRGLMIVRHRIGLSLPIVVFCYIFMVVMLILPEWASPMPIFVHKGLDIWSPFLISVTTALIVLPLAVRDLIQKQWYGILAIPLALCMFFAWGLLYSHLISTGKVILEE